MQDSPIVLVADEDKDIRFLIRVYLREYDVNIIEARGGGECLKLIEEKQPSLVIINYMFGDKTGYQVAEEIPGSGDEKIPLIMMTLEGFDLIEDKAGVSAYLAKPFNREQFSRALEKTLGKGMFKLKEEEIQEPAAGPEEEKSDMEETAGSDDKELKRIVIADDDPYIIKMYKVLLEDKFELEFASTGEELVEKCLCDKYDLIISDIVMPKLSGWKSVRRLREEGIRTPVLFNSGLVKDQELYETLKPEGRSRFILKPFKKQDLLDAVKDLTV